MKNKCRIGIFMMVAVFTILGTVSVQASTSAKSTLKISGATQFPSSVVKGKGVSITGTIFSNYTISKITVQILKSNKAVSGITPAAFNPKAKSYNLNKISSKICISKLKAGSYTYRVIAQDSKQTKILQTVIFKVAAPNTVEITNYAYLLGIHLADLESKYGEFKKTAYIDPGNTDQDGNPITCYYYSSNKFQGLRFAIYDNAIKVADRDTIIGISTTSKSYTYKGWGVGLTEAQLKNNFLNARVHYSSYFETSPGKTNSYFLQYGKYLVVFRYNLLDGETLLDFYLNPSLNGW